MDGAVEGFDLDSRTSFERKFNVDTNGFWGSQSWRRLHDSPNWYNKTFGVFDFYHLADDLRKLGYLLGAILLGVGVVYLRDIKKNWTRFVSVGVALFVAFATSGLIKSLAMEWIRN